MIILISGKQGSGKTTLSNGLMDLSRRHFVSSWPGGFAKAMRAIVQTMSLTAKSVGCPIPEKVETRELMNFIATTWGRGINPDFWIPPVIKDYKQIAELWKNRAFFLYIIDDFRCLNEANAFNDLDDVYRIRLQCPEEYRRKRAKYWGDPTHVSEVDLDNYGNFDLTMDTLEATPEENANRAYELIMERIKDKLKGN
jgi:hypothetical protein